MNDLISVIVPIYNVEKYIRKCLDSICMQSYCNLEIILINDGSFDKSGKICDEYAKTDSRIHVIHQKNMGVSKTRNFGIKVATGAYIIFVDSDDWVVSSFVEKLYNLVQVKDAQLAMIGVIKEYELFPINPPVLDVDKVIETKIMTSEQTLNNILNENMYLGYVCNKIFKRELIIEKNIKFQETVKIWEDLLFCCHYISHISNAVYCNEKLYIYNIRQNSATNSNNYINEYTRLVALEMIMDLFNKSNDAFIEKIKVMYFSTAIQIVYSHMFSNGIYDTLFINKKIIQAKTYIKIDGIPFKIKVYYVGLKYSPKISYYIYRLVKKIKSKISLPVIKLRKN